MIEIINREKDISEVNTMSPLTWAYVGDAQNEFSKYKKIKATYVTY